MKQAPFVSLILSLSLFLGMFGLSSPVSASQADNSPVKVGIAAKYDNWVYVNQQNHNYKLGRISKSDDALHTFNDIPEYRAIVGDNVYYADPNNPYHLLKQNIYTGKSELVLNDGYVYGNDDSYLYFSNDIGVTALSSFSTKENEISKIADYVEYFCAADGFVYYYGMDKDYVNTELYRSKPDGTGTKLMGDTRFPYNSPIKGDYIYYVKNFDKSYLCRSTLDGKQETKLSPCDGLNLAISGPWLFFTRFNAKTYELDLYRIDPDHPEKEYFVINGVMNFSAGNNEIYYLASSDGKLCSVNTDGTSNKKIADKISGSSFTVSGDSVFFKIREEDYGLLKIDAAGNKQKIVEGKLSNVYLYNNDAYYLDKGGRLSKTSLAGGTAVVLVQSPVSAFRIDGDLIYFIYRYNDTIRTLKLDGSGEPRAIYGNFSDYGYYDSNYDFDIIDGYIYYYNLDARGKTLVRVRMAADGER